MSDFIKEKIVRRTEAGRSFRTVIKTIIGAILFGVIAACVFVIAMPYAQSTLGTETESTTEERVTIPRDETEAATLEAAAQQQEQEGVSDIETASDESAEETEEETIEDGELINDITLEETMAPVEEIVQEVMSGYDYTMDDFKTLWSNIAELCDSSDSSIVTVRAKRNEENEDDLFGEKQKDNSYSGIVIAETFNESMILTDIGAVSDNASSIEIEWTGGAIQQAYLRKTDEITGLAIVCARKEDMSDPVRMLAVPMPLGNSYTVRRGDLLIAVGAPCGEIHSTGYTWASYIKKNEDDVDGTQSLIYTGEEFDGGHGTWMLNASGELIGWVRDDAVVGISGYKSLLESMINSTEFPYLGVVAADIPAGTNIFENAPVGIYVKDTVTDGPAYNAGILPGDIITEIGETEIHTMNEFGKALENLRPGEEVTVIVYRDSRGDYKEIEYLIEVGSR